jgi:hypothetical protein
MKLGRRPMNRHAMLMILCCAVPILLIAAIGTFGLSFGPLSALAPYAIALMCPLMMVFMMFGHKHEDEHAHHPQTVIDTDIVTAKSEPSVAELPSAQGRCH